MVNPAYLPNGKEQYAHYISNATHEAAVQYDYRHTDGELFSCVKPTLRDCWRAKEDWLKRKDEETRKREEA